MAIVQVKGYPPFFAPFALFRDFRDPILFGDQGLGVFDGWGKYAGVFATGEVLQPARGIDDSIDIV
jgi:hypothetical protein